MHLEILAEEPGVEALLAPLLTPWLAAPDTYRVHNLRGKDRLLRELPVRLRGYRNWDPEGLRIVVLVDRDRDDCRELKGRLEGMAREAGLRTRTSDPFRYQIVNRVAVEELEAWLLGDPQALRAAYPRLPTTFELTVPFRDPDAIVGGTAEALERLLQSAGYAQAGLAKGTVAGEVARHMVPARNESKSFQTFWSALTDMLELANRP